MSIRYKETIWCPRAKEEYPRMDKLRRGSDLIGKGIILNI